MSISSPVVEAPAAFIEERGCSELDVVSMGGTNGSDGTANSHHDRA